MKSINIVIPNEVYPFDVMFSAGQSDSDFLKSLEDAGEESCDDERLKDLGSQETKGGRTVLLVGRQTILRINFWPKTSTEFAMLQHEIFHVVEFILSMVGMKLCRKSDEAYAYLIQFYTKKIYEALGFKE